MRRFLLVMALVAAACRKEVRPAVPHAPKPLAVQHDDWDELPALDAYAGSAACKECHEKNYLRWSHDWHSRALQKAEEGAVVGRFDGAHYKGDSSEAWMKRHAGEYVMRTRDGEGRLGDYAVSWVIGGKRMQDAVTVMDDGRWQVLPVYYHVTGKGAWVDYNAAKQGRVGPDHPNFWTNFARTANKECLDCHATGIDIRYDRATRTWSTSFADAGVACEACHGPGARHAETKDKRDILHPGHTDKERELSICARCHGPREPLFPLLDTQDQFRPGQLYDEKYQALVVVDGTERSGEFFADGRPSSSSFEYQSLIQSRCHRNGSVTCLTCHTPPHAEHGANEMNRDVDHSCRACHKAVVAEGEAHTHHKSRAGASCTGCHMPRLLSGVLDKFPDHSIDIPNADNTLRHGVPNACNVCHGTKPADELVTTIAAWWPKAAARQARRTRLADAIDERTAAMSLAPLTAVVRDSGEAPTLRGAAAVLLGQRFPREASAILVPLLDDESPVVRARLIEALGYARARDAAGALERYANDPSVAVRQNAALVLVSLGQPSGEAAAQRLAGNPLTRNLFRPHVVRAIAAGNRGELDAAAEEITSALTQVPYATDALVFLADLHARRGDLPAARRELEEALRFDPRHRGAKSRLEAMQGK